MLLQIDGTFIIAFMSFIVFLFIIKAILYNPVQKMKGNREAFFENNKKIKDESDLKSNELILDKEEKLKNAKKEASVFIKETIDEIEKENVLILEKIQKDADDSLENKKARLNKEIADAKNEIKFELENIVNQIVHKAVNTDLNINLDDATIEKHLKI